MELIIIIIINTSSFRYMHYPSKLFVADCYFQLHFP